MDGLASKRRAAGAMPRKGLTGAAPKKAGRVETLSLPAVSKQHIDGINALCRRRGPVAFAIQGHEFHVGAADGAAVDQGAHVVLKTAHGPARFFVPRALLAAWLQEADPEADLDAMQPAQQALLLEALFSAELDWLEQKLESIIEVTEVAQKADKRGSSPFRVAWTVSGEGHRGTLSFDDAGLAHALAALLDEAADSASLAAPTAPVPIRILYGAAVVMLGELEELERGDVILLSDNGYHAARACCLIGEKRAAPIVPLDDGWRLGSRFISLTGSEWDFNMATNHKVDADEGEENAGLADLPVTLVFEAGRTAMALDEVQRLDAGSLIPLNAPLDGGVTIFASGKRVGRGELVKLGDGLGVRVLNIFAND
jgi:type III secretion protein Q